MSIEKILIIDEDKNSCSVLRTCFEKEGCSVILSHDGEEGLLKFNALKPDVILLDVSVPKIDGWQICREIRKKSNIPLLIISAKNETFDKVLGLELGADDYVVKPFSPKELMSRIDAIMRRVGKRADPASSAAAFAAPPAHDEYICGGLRVDFTGRIVWIDGVRADLSPKEYELLFYLIRNRNIALTREKLITEVWGYDFFGDDRTLDTHVKLLRRSLGKYSAHIVTLRGVGYRFESDH